MLGNASHREGDRMNIAIFTDSFPPEISSCAVLMNELATEMTIRGHSVTVITYQPHGRINIDVSLPVETRENEITIIRIKAPQTHIRNLIRRGLNTIAASLLLERKSKAILKNSSFDVVLAYSPPLNLALSAAKFAREIDSRFFLILRDIFPQNAVDIGAITNKLVIRYFEKLEKSLYSASNFVLCQSDANKDFLENQRGLDSKKVKVLYNWLSLDNFDRIPTRDFRKELNIEDKFVALYGGTMGIYQGLEEVIALAERMKSKTDIVFLLIGNGIRKDNLISLVSKKQLDNVVFGDYVPPEDFPELARSADVGLMPLARGNTTPVVPGKLVSYLAAGLPILAFINRESVDTIRIINESNSGFCISDYDYSKIDKAFDRLYYDDSLRSAMGSNGRAYVQTHFTVQHALDIIEELFGNQ